MLDRDSDHKNHTTTHCHHRHGDRWRRWSPERRSNQSLIKNQTENDLGTYQNESSDQGTRDGTLPPVAVDVVSSPPAVLELPPATHVLPNVTSPSRRRGWLLNNGVGCFLLAVARRSTGWLLEAFTAPEKDRRWCWKSGREEEGWRKREMAAGFGSRVPGSDRRKEERVGQGKDEQKCNSTSHEPMTSSSTGKRHRVYRPYMGEGQEFDSWLEHSWGIFSRLATRVRGPSSA
ncbi:hypothetical protein LXL04_033760 [Taraxacum kok-saghyz]